MLICGLEINWKCWPYKYEYSCYGIRFNERWQFSLPDASWGKNSIIAVVDNSFSVHEKLVISEYPTQWLGDTWTVQHEHKEQKPRILLIVHNQEQKCVLYKKVCIIMEATVFIGQFSKNVSIQSKWFRNKITSIAFR